MNRERRIAAIKIGIFAAALAPLTALVFSGFTGGLGANPVETITHTTGEWTLRLLLATLAITPLRHITGWVWLTRLRRMVGLFAFFYLMLHFTTYAVLDASLDLAYVLEDVADRLYITAGFAALVMLVPLAATSTNAMGAPARTAAVAQAASPRLRGRDLRGAALPVAREGRYPRTARLRGHPRRTARRPAAGRRKTTEAAPIRNGRQGGIAPRAPDEQTSRRRYAGIMKLPRVGGW